MSLVGNLEFAHRENEDGTFDSICLSCYLTVASAEKEAALFESEKFHTCGRDDIAARIPKDTFGTGTRCL